MEEKREKAHPMGNSVAFSDEIPNMNMSMSTSFSFPFTSSIFDMMPPSSSSSCDQKASSFAGFMDLLAVQDYSPSLFDWLPTIATTALPHNSTIATATQIDYHPLPSPASSNVPDGSEVLNTPASPNSSSISSSSNEAAAANNNIIDRKAENEHEAEDEDGDGDGDGGRGDHQDHDKTKKQLKPKKKNQKKQRDPRFAFMTKSEVDHLDDGYRWRKYGQKAVKHSPYPRSYYRCTTGGCGVKKRVERSSDDPTIVVTTYEGQHTHPCPATSRAALGFMHEPAGFSAGSGVGALGSPHFVQLSQHHQQQFHQHHNVQQAAAALLYNSTPSLNIVSSPSNFVNSTSSFSNFFQDQDNHRSFAPSSVTMAHQALLRDNGLLQDIVPTQMRKEEKEDE